MLISNIPAHVCYSGSHTSQKGNGLKDLPGGRRPAQTWQRTEAAPNIISMREPDLCVAEISE